MTLWPKAVDAGGLGSAGVFDRLIELGQSVGRDPSVKAVTDSDDLVNARFEWYRNLRARFGQGDIYVDPNDDQLAKQLGNIEWNLTPKVQTCDRVERRKRREDFTHKTGQMPCRTTLLKLIFPSKSTVMPA